VGVVSGTAQLKLAQSMQAASAENRIQMNLFSTGSPGLAPVGQLLASLQPKAGDLNGLLQAMGGYLSAFKSTDAVPTQFKVIPITDLLVGIADGDIWTTQKERELAAIADRYNTIARELDIATAIIAGTDPRKILFPDATSIGLLSSFVSTATPALQKLADSQRACEAATTLDDASCSLPVSVLQNESSVPSDALPGPATFQILEQFKASHMPDSQTVLTTILDPLVTENLLFSNNNVDNLAQAIFALNPAGTYVNAELDMVASGYITRADCYLNNALVNSIVYSGTQHQVTLVMHRLMNTYVWGGGITVNDLAPGDCMGPSLLNASASLTGSWFIRFTDLMGNTFDRPLVNIVTPLQNVVWSPI
jgi:hypothetical protein